MSAIKLSTLNDTARFAQQLAPLLCVGDVVTLMGDVGAGKTTFAQSLINALSVQLVEVTSPTFTLLQTYPITAGGVACECYHYDLYRIEEESALIELGLEDALSGVTLIEWPERLGRYTLPVSLALSFTIQDDGARMVHLTDDPRWRTLSA